MMLVFRNVIWPTNISVGYFEHVNKPQVSTERIFLKSAPQK